MAQPQPARSRRWRRGRAGDGRGRPWGGRAEAEVGGPEQKVSAHTDSVILATVLDWGRAGRRRPPPRQGQEDRLRCSSASSLGPGSRAFATSEEEGGCSSGALPEVIRRRRRWLQQWSSSGGDTVEDGRRGRNWTWLQ